MKFWSCSLLASSSSALTACLCFSTLRPLCSSLQAAFPIISASLVCFSASLSPFLGPPACSLLSCSGSGSLIYSLLLILSDILCLLLLLLLLGGLYDGDLGLCLLGGLGDSCLRFLDGLLRLLGGLPPKDLSLLLAGLPLEDLRLRLLGGELLRDLCLICLPLSVEGFSLGLSLVSPPSELALKCPSILW